MPNTKYIYYLFWFGWVLWHINHCRQFNIKSTLYIHIKYIGFVLVRFYGVSTVVGYLMSNPLYTYILNIYDVAWLGLWRINHCWLFNVKSTLYIYIKYIWFVLVRFYGISTIVGYLMSNPLYTYILNLWFVLVRFYDISIIVGYLMSNPLYTYILNIYDLFWLGLLHIKHCRLFNVKSSLYIHIKYIRFGLVGFYGISTIACYSMSNSLYICVLNNWFVNTFS